MKLIFVLSFLALSASVEKMRCRDYVGTSNGEHFNKCVKHLTHPRFKIGNILKVPNKNFDTNCRFIVTYPDWSLNLEAPFYVGKLKCAYFTEERRIFLEKDLEEKE